MNFICIEYRNFNKICNIRSPFLLIWLGFIISFIIKFYNMIHHTVYHTLHHHFFCRLNRCIVLCMSTL